MFAHWDNLQIHVNQSWIGIEGLPINMWNIHVFKIIGKALGGLLDVAPETRTFRFLKFAKIKVRGLEGGFMDPVMEILCQGLHVSLGIFDIVKPRNYSGAGRTFGVLTRVVRAEEGGGGIVRLEEHGRTGPVNILKTTKPLFVLGNKNQDDVAARRGKEVSAQSYKDALLSAGSEQEGRKEVTGLANDKISLLANRADGDRCSRLSKEGEISESTVLENATSENRRLNTYELMADPDFSKIALDDGVGQGRVSQCKSKGYLGLGIISQINKIGGLGQRFKSQNSPHFNVMGRGHNPLVINRNKCGPFKINLSDTNSGGLLGLYKAQTSVTVKPVSVASTKLNGLRLLQGMNDTGHLGNRFTGDTNKLSNSRGVTTGNYSEIIDHNQEASGYFSEIEISNNKSPFRRAVSVPIYQKEIRNSKSKVIKRVVPKPKEGFCSGRIFKWTDFSFQPPRKEQGNSNLSVQDHCNEVDDVMNKSATLNVYSRKFLKKQGRGKKTTQISQPGQKLECALLGDTERSDDELAVEGLSSSDDDNSSEEFNNTSDVDVEAEKQIQEEAAYEGMRWLLGDGSQENEKAIGRKEVHLLSQPNHIGYSDHHFSNEGGKFLDNPNIIESVVDKENCEGGISHSKRSGVRELRNLICKVNYEKASRGKGKIRCK